MDRLLKSLILVLFIAAAPAAVFAQDEAAAAAEARTQEFLQTLSGFDESLVGVTFFGVYINKTQNIGNARFEVVKAPEGAGGTYLVKMTINLQMGPRKFTQAQEAILDEKFALVSARDEADMPDGKKSSTLSKESGEWVFDVKWQKPGEDVENSTKLTHPVEGPNYKERSSGMLVLRKIGVDSARDFLFHGIAWPEVQKDEEGDPEEVDIWTKIQAPSAQKHRGKEVQASLVRIEDEGEDEVTIIQVGSDSSILAFWPEDAPICVIAGTEEESTKSIQAETSAVEHKKAKTPTEAVMTYLMVLAKEVEVDALDAVMDWKAIHEEMAGENPDIAAMSPEVLAGIMKGQFKQSPKAITMEQVNAIEMLLGVVEEGEKASVTIPGADKPFKLRKTDGVWKITMFPH